MTLDAASGRRESLAQGWANGMPMPMMVMVMSNVTRGGNILLRDTSTCSSIEDPMNVLAGRTKAPCIHGNNKLQTEFVSPKI